MDEARALVQSRRLPSESTAASARLTNFYPLYGAANDQVDPVSPVQPVLFQRVIPRYRLSTSETRDQGLGPTFVDIPQRPGNRAARNPPAARAEAARAEAARAHAAPAEAAVGAETAAGTSRLEERQRPAAAAATRHLPPEPWLGRRVDVLA